MTLGRRTMLLALICSFHYTCFAQVLTNDSINTINLDEVVVTGTGTLHNYKTAPVQTQVISKKELKKFGGKNIQDILGSLNPSFTFNQSDMGSGIQLGGLKNDYILILVDGKRLNGDVGGQNDLSSIDIDNIQRIEIVKGGASSLYGSDAIAGVINIITKKENVLKKIASSVSNVTRLGSYGEWRQSNRLNLKLGKLKSTTSYSRSHTDGWMNTNKEIGRTGIEETVTKTVSANTNYRVGEKLHYQFNKRLSVEAQGSYYNKQIFRECGPIQYRTFDLEYKSYSTSLDLLYKLSNYNKFTLSVNYDKRDYYHNHNTDMFESYKDEDGHYLYFKEGDDIKQNTQERLTVQGKGVYALADNHMLNFGVEYLHDFLKPYKYIYPHNSEAFIASTYLQDEWQLADNFNITGGLRVNYHREFGFHFTPKLSAMYLMNKFVFRASYSSGFKSPTLKQLYYNYTREAMGFTEYLSNKDLRPQTSNYFSLAVEYNTDKWSISATGSVNLLDNVIELYEVKRTNAQILRGIQKSKQYQNIADAYSNGLDLVAKYTPNDHVTLGGGYSFIYAHGNILNKDNEIESVMLDGSAMHNANLFATWNNKWKNHELMVGFYGNGQSKRFYRYHGDTDPYCLFKLTSTYDYKGFKHLDLSTQLGVDNLFDYRCTKPHGYNYNTKSAGRTFFISCSLKLK